MFILIRSISKYNQHTRELMWFINNKTAPENGNVVHDYKIKR